MKHKKPLTQEDIQLFRDSMKGVNKITQDTYYPKVNVNKSQRREQRVLEEQKEALFYFSDEYQPRLNQEGPTSYHREDIDRYEVKKIRRGDYIPELFLDLHGLTQAQAKEELAALITACQREHAFCACVMHGYGQNILRRQVPLWLAQHPAILAFHQAPKIFGGDAAILLLVELSD